VNHLIAPINLELEVLEKIKGVKIMTVMIKPKDQGMSFMVGEGNLVFEGVNGNGDEFVVLEKSIELATQKARAYFKDDSLEVKPDYFSKKLIETN